MAPDPLTMVALGGVAAAAGVVDAIAGGGGLLTVPALLYAGLPPHEALATNKGQSVFGSGAALYRFSHSPLLDRTRVRMALYTAPPAAALGVAAVALVSPALLRPVVAVLLAAVAVFMMCYRVPAVRPAHARPPGRVWAAVVAGGIAFYDGFFGPGTGTFLILAYILRWHEPADVASANAKVVNFASNAGALAVFAALGLVHWQLAAPMAVGQLVGGWIGAHLTVRRGAGLVRLAVVLVCLALLVKLSHDMLVS